jgi:hypothetical protein
MGLELRGVIRCGRCGKSRGIRHVCITSRTRKRRHKAQSPVQWVCSTCRKPRGLRHTCAVRDRLQEAPPGRRPQTRHGRTPEPAPADRGQAEAAPPAGRHRTAGPDQDAHLDVQARGQAARRRARPRGMPGPVVRAVRVQEVPGRPTCSTAMPGPAAIPTGRRSSPQRWMPPGWATPVRYPQG